MTVMTFAVATSIDGRIDGTIATSIDGTIDASIFGGRVARTRTVR